MCVYYSHVEDTGCRSHPDEGERGSSPRPAGHRRKTPRSKKARSQKEYDEDDELRSSSYGESAAKGRMPIQATIYELDLYSVLGASIMASDEELRRCWKKRALENHPDRHAGDPNATIRFQAIQHAYNVLKDRRRRSEYDKALLHRLYAEEYLGRFVDLLLTSSGLGLNMNSYTYAGSVQNCQDEWRLGASPSPFFLTATMHRSKSFGNL
jgi:DnaJ-domain-containing protein 1